MPPPRSYFLFSRCPLVAMPAAFLALLHPCRMRLGVRVVRAGFINLYAIPNPLYLPRLQTRHVSESHTVASKCGRILSSAVRKWLAAS